MDPVTDAVENDVREGINDIFEIRSFEYPLQVVGDATLGALAWIAHTTHVGEFDGIAPTHREVDIAGATFVENATGNAVFRRVIDWAGVYAQLGVSTNGRTVNDV